MLRCVILARPQHGARQGEATFLMEQGGLRELQGLGILSFLHLQLCGVIETEACHCLGQGYIERAQKG